MRETVEALKKKGICPTCYNREHGGVYDDYRHKLIYENEDFVCFFEDHPRARGHVILLANAHYNDMSALPDPLCAAMFLFAKRAMNALKEALAVERVYLCTMCDGKVNHFHLQLIPRHPGTPIGSRNFVAERGKYEHDEALLARLRLLLADDNAGIPEERK